MSDHNERACTKCGSLLHHEDDCSRQPSMSDQQPSKTPRTDEAGLQCPDCFEFILVPSIGDYYRCPKCNIGDWSEKALCLFKKGVAAGHKQLETELSTANAEVARLKKLAQFESAVSLPILRANPEDTSALESDFDGLIGLLTLRQASLTGLPQDHPHKQGIAEARDSAKRELVYRSQQGKADREQLNNIQTHLEVHGLRTDRDLHMDVLHLCGYYADLLANSKALAEDLKLESEHYASLEAHNKLMEQLSPTTAGSGMGG